MHRRLALVALAAFTAALACAPAESPHLARADRRVVASFSGEADALAGTLTLDAVSSAPGALQELPVVRDRVRADDPGRLRGRRRVRGAHPAPLVLRGQLPRERLRRDPRGHADRPRGV